MTGTILSRLVWKEYRLLRGFWWAMLAAAVLGQLFVLWESDGPGDAYWVFLVGMGLTACYALGCGATAFAGERELGTDVLQRVIPVRPPQLLMGKVLFAAISTVMFGVLAWLIAAMLLYLRWHTLADSHVELAVLGAFKCIELLVWGIFFSLLLAQPLRAVVIAALATAVIAYPLSWLLSDIPESARTIFYFPSFLGDAATVIPRVIIVMLVVGCNFRLAARWFRESGGQSADRNAREMRLNSLARYLSARLHWNPQGQRLLWQTLIRSRWMIATAALAYLVLLLLGISIVENAGLDYPIAVCALIPVAGMMGIFVFADDQLRHQFRFFAEHGVSGRRVWWSRQVFWSGLFLLSLLATAAAEFAQTRPDLDELGIFCGIAILAYTSGQLCTQWIRSTIVAVPVTVALAAVLVTLALGVNPLGAAAAIPFVLLFATWATADDWVRERTKGWARVRKTLVLAVPTLLIFIFVIFFRCLQIPATTPQFAKNAYTTTEIKDGDQTAKMYIQLASELPTNRSAESDVHLDSAAWKYPHDIDFHSPYLLPAETQWIDTHQDWFERAADVSRRDHCIHSALQGNAWSSITTVRWWVILSARRQQQIGNLDAALDRYVTALRIGRHQVLLTQWAHAHFQTDGEQEVLHYLRYWSIEPGQTPELIHRAIKDLGQVWSMPFDPEIGVATRYHRIMKTLSEVAAGQEVSGDYPVRSPRTLYWCYRLMPWERVRAERLAAFEAQVALDSISEWRSSQSRKVPLKFRRFDRHYERLSAWKRTTLGPLDPYDWIGDTVARAELLRRGTKLVLALQGWRLEHGRLPESLEMLVPDWLDELPLDPMTARPFSYYRHGREFAFSTYSYAGWNLKLTLPAKTPYLEARDPYSPDRTILFPVESGTARRAVSL